MSKTKVDRESGVGSACESEIRIKQSKNKVFLQIVSHGGGLNVGGDDGIDGRAGMFGRDGCFGSEGGRNSSGAGCCPWGA
jgi:hypothetical protein